MFSIRTARSDSFITALPVASRYHLSCGMLCSGLQPSMPWAQHFVSGRRVPSADMSFICKDIKQHDYQIRKLKLKTVDTEDKLKTLIEGLKCSAQESHVVFFCARYRFSTVESLLTDLSITWSRPYYRILIIYLYYTVSVSHDVIINVASFNTMSLDFAVHRPQQLIKFACSSHCDAMRT